MLKNAIEARNQRLKKMASDAIAQYNADMAAGSEPLFPDWTLELLGLISAYDEMVRTLANSKLLLVDSQDLEARTVRTGIIQWAEHAANASASAAIEKDRASAQICARDAMYK